VSLQLERRDAPDDPDYAKWLRMLIAPGGSLGGARPKASVVDKSGALWIAKFPSRRDDDDAGGWEGVIHSLAAQAGLRTAPAQTLKFGSEHHTFLTKRFDRGSNNRRHHFASAMTLLQRNDGDDAVSGVSYLDLAEFIVRLGSQPDRDLEELWRRIIFFICVSNTDDHLRNHGFLLDSAGWSLAPAYDMNPNSHGVGLRLNISETDNAQSLALAQDVAPFFRVSHTRCREILLEVVEAVSRWRKLAKSQGISRDEQERMAPAFEQAQT
jgi:serine/threonine-protein kinase HipA